MNKIQLLGYLDQIPEIHLHGQQREKATFSLPTHITCQNEQGDWQTKIDWHSITVFKPVLIEWFKESIRIGDLLFVQGYLSYEETPLKKKKIPHIIVADLWGQIFRICENDLKQSLKLPFLVPTFTKTTLLETANDDIPF